MVGKLNLWGKAFLLIFVDRNFKDTFYKLGHLLKALLQRFTENQNFQLKNRFLNKLPVKFIDKGNTGYIVTLHLTIYCQRLALFKKTNRTISTLTIIYGYSVQ